MGEFIEEASDILVGVVIVEDPPQPLVKSDNVVVQFVFVHSIVGFKLFLQHCQKYLIREKIVDRVSYLLNIEIDVTFEIFIPGWM